MSDTREVLNVESPRDSYNVMRMACCGAMANVLRNFPDVHTTADGIYAVAEANFSSFSAEFLTEDPGKLQTLFMEFYQYGYDSFTQYLEHAPAVCQQLRVLADAEQTHAIGMLADASIQAYVMKHTQPKKARGKRLKKKKR